MNPDERRDVQRHDGMVVGYVEGDTYYKKVLEKKHRPRYPPGWANDEVALQNASSLEAMFVEIFAKDTGVTYRTSIRNIWEKGIKINRGHGDQIVLCVEHWKIIDPKQRELL